MDLYCRQIPLLQNPWDHHNFLLKANCKTKKNINLFKIIPFCCNTYSIWAPVTPFREIVGTILKRLKTPFDTIGGWQICIIVIFNGYRIFLWLIKLTRIHKLVKICLHFLSFIDWIIKHTGIILWIQLKILKQSVYFHFLWCLKGCIYTLSHILTPYNISQSSSECFQL